MAETLEEYMCKYIKKQTILLKGCLLAALEEKNKSLSLLDQSLGTPIPSQDIKLCETLTNAGLFRQEIELTRDGRNRYKVFCLTDLGKEMAEKIKKEGFNGKMPKNSPIT